MIETLPDRPEPAEIDLPPGVASEFASFRRQIAARSQIVWGEHCSECAYPSCYAHCAFYTPRSDFNCRRFEAGFEPVAADPALHRVRFRKWGKLEGRGPVQMLPAATAQAADRRDAQVAGLLSAIPAPAMLKQNLAWRWNTRKGSGPDKAPVADAFVVEAWASDGQTHRLTLTLLNPANHAGALFQTSLEVDARYRRLTVPLAAITERVDLAAPFLVQIEPVGEAEGVAVVFGVCDFVTLEACLLHAPGPASPVDPNRLAKVVVWDLDETLWTGVLAEDGAAGVLPRPEAVAAVKMLDARGVLQSIASKNDAGEAMAALERFGLAEYFLHPQVHWNPKSGSVAAISRALDLGLDSIVFIDDQPFERAEVEAAHPAVRTLSHTEVEGLAVHPWFDTPATPESARRRAMYRQEAQRTEAFETAGADYPAFLRASGLRLAVASLAPADVERVFELSQRTNQLNFNGRKYTREAVKALVESRDGRTGYTLRCADRFGDYGLIGFVEVDIAAGLVREFFMSCRVQRKRVEQALFAWLLAEATAAGAQTLSVAYTATGRNGAARDMLEGLGFAPSGEGVWARPTTLPIAEADIVSLSVHPALAAETSAA